MKTVVFLLSVITLVGSVAAQSSMQPPPLFKKRTQTSSTRRNAVRNPYRANPVRDNQSSLYGESVDTPASKLTTQLDDAIRLQSSDPSRTTGKSPRSIYDLDRSKVRLAGGEDDELRVAPAQFMPNQDFSNRPADGFLSARDSDRKDPATGNGLKLSPIPTAPTARSNNSLYENQGPKPPLDFGKPASNPADTRKTGPSFFPATGNTTGGSLYGNNATGNNRNDSASVYQAGHQDNAAGTDNEPYLPTISDTSRSQPSENFIPAGAAGSNVAEQSKPKSIFDDDSLKYNQHDQGAGYASSSNSTGLNVNQQPAPRARTAQSPGFAYGDSQTQRQAQAQEQRRQARRTNPNFSQPGTYGNPQQTVQPQNVQSTPAPVHRAGQQQVAQQAIQQPLQHSVQPAPQGNIAQSPYGGSAYPATTYPPAATTTPAVVGTQPPAQQITAPVVTPSTVYSNRIAPPDLRNSYPPQIAQASTPNFKPVTGDGQGVAPENGVAANNGVTSNGNTTRSYNNGNYEQGGVGIMTLLALFASIGLNVYLGWIAYDTYNRYQDLVADMRRTPARRSDRRERRTERRVTEAAY